MSTQPFSSCLFTPTRIGATDLDHRKDGHALNRHDRATFHGGDARGYVDYPASEVAA